MKQFVAVIIVTLLLFSCHPKPMEEQPHGFFPVKEYGKWGFINSAGQKVIDCKFIWAGMFSEGRAPVLIDSLYGFIDTTGNVVIKPQFYRPSYFSEGLCHVTMQHDTTFKYAFIRPDGSIAFYTPYEDVGPFSDLRAEVTINNEVCYIDTTGRVVLNTHYASGGGRYNNGITLVWGGHGGWVNEGGTNVWEGDSSAYLNIKGQPIKIVAGIGCSRFSERLALVDSYYIDITGKARLTPHVGDVTFYSFSNGMAQIWNGNTGKSGFIDTSGILVIPAIYKSVCDFQEGLAAFRDSAGWGFMDKTGKVIIKPKFDWIDQPGFYNGLCKCIINHRHGYINHKGEFVWIEQTCLQYQKLDLSKWSLDTLALNKTHFLWFEDTWDNYQHKGTFAKSAAPTLRVDTADLTVFQDHYFAYKLYLENPGKDTVNVTLREGKIRFTQQALNKKGAWQDIDNFYYYYGGRTIDQHEYPEPLYPGMYQITAVPLFKGNFTTMLRYKTEMNGKPLYSNVYYGQINPCQFIAPKDADEELTMMW